MKFNIIIAILSLVILTQAASCLSPLPPQIEENLQQASFFNFTNCAGYNWDDYVTDWTIFFQPTIPRAGSPFFLNGQGTANRNFYVDHGIVEFKYNGIDIATFDIPWGQTYSTGEVFTARHHIPSAISLPGRYTFNMNVFDQTGNAIMCVEGWLILQRPQR